MSSDVSMLILTKCLKAFNKDINSKSKKTRARIKQMLRVEGEQPVVRARATHLSL